MKINKLIVIMFGGILFLGSCASKTQKQDTLVTDSVAVCGQNKPELLKGRWEMPLSKDPSLRGQMENAGNLTYSMELNLAERTFMPELDLPSGEEKCYGWMDFSNLSRIYHYDIDSVFYLGRNTYKVVSIDGWNQLSTDTLVYYPDTKVVYIKNNDFTFQPIPDDKPFNGEWEIYYKNEEDPDWDMSVYYKLSLYKKIEVPKDYPFEGVKCYGYGIQSSQDNAYYVIDSILSIHYDYAEVQRCFVDYPESVPDKMHLVFNRSDGSLSINGDEKIPCKKSDQY